MAVISLLLSATQFLSESQSAFRGPSTHNMAGFSIEKVAAAKFFPINGDDLALEGRMQAGRPPE